MSTAHRTFDCPWCGAISPVPTDHMGEHYACPECKKQTKLTAKNTSGQEITAPPVGAPHHLSGDRTFDCPWCGSITAVPSSHLGERFHCGECGKETKLTSTNTQRAPVTAPPPEAPHVETGSRRALWLALPVVAAAAVAIFLLTSQSSDPPKEVATSGAPPRETASGSSAPTGTPSPAPSLPAMPSPGTPPAMPSPGPEPATPSMPTPGAPSPGMPTPGMPTPGMPAPPAAAESPALVEARATRAAAAVAFAAAQETHGRAATAVEAWTKAHPGALEAARALSTLLEVEAEATRLRAEKASFADPAQPTPAEVRAYRAALAKFVEASPVRVQVATQVLGLLRNDLGGREVAGITDWRGVPFHGEGFQRALTRLVESAKATAVPLPADLETALATAEAARAKARQELDAASAAVTALETGK